MQVRTATTDDLEDLLQILDAAALETDPGRTRRSIERDRTVVAVEDGHLLGTAVAVPAYSSVEIDAIAVRKRRQGQGIGTALVEALLAEHERVVAEFDERVRPFYASLDFEIESVSESNRFRGCRGPS